MALLTTSPFFRLIYRARRLHLLHRQPIQREPTPTKIDELPASLVEGASRAIVDVQGVPMVAPAMLPLSMGPSTSCTFTALLTFTESTAPSVRSDSSEGESVFQGSGCVPEERWGAGGGSVTAETRIGVSPLVSVG